MFELRFLDFKNKELLDKIFEWRNDPNTRINSNNTNIITEEIFDLILNKYKESKIKPLIAYANNIPVGILTFVESNSKIYIGININPLERSNGYGKLILKYFLDNYKNFIYQTTVIYAEVKKINIPSVNLFSKFFDLNEENDTSIVYFKNLVI